MTKYLEYEYEDDDGNIVHVKEPRNGQPDKPDDPGAKKFWIVLCIGILVWLFIVNPLMKSCEATVVETNDQIKQQQKESQQWKDYSDCLSDHMTDGRSYVCDSLKP